MPGHNGNGLKIALVIVSVLGVGLFAVLQLLRAADLQAVGDKITSLKTADVAILKKDSVLETRFSEAMSAFALDRRDWMAYMKAQDQNTNAIMDELQISPYRRAHAPWDTLRMLKSRKGN